ncbi:hypothetical protein J2128_001957 [Methanomicrobium sp. W14]|uniref:hypothetical protein n=1 Tax=Methanomicrobium sp. W14 TaxID=2817839 RepID=UPI001AEA271F|nr:hypothetical protein [Methanomicrobium sp. W14]MBP2133991.1 hypothetical protein [Methanomicrobium sp. W14]
MKSINIHNNTLIMEKVCDICGFKNLEDACFCGGCGVDLRENDESPKSTTQKKKTSPPKKEKVDDQENNQQDKIIKWCQIYSAMTFHELTLPLFLALIIQFVNGDKYLGFCNCSACNSGYRQIQTDYINLTENKNLKYNSREIVSRFHDDDISQFFFDLSKLCKSKKPQKEDYQVNQSEKTTKLSDKISIDIDKIVLENLLLKVLSSENGQELLKKSLK